MDPETQRRWMEQWKAASLALEEHRRSELRALTDERARRASEAVLAFAVPGRISPARRSLSGLVEQQRLFHAQKPR